MNKLSKYIFLAVAASLLAGLAARIFQVASPVTREVIAVVKRDDSATKGVGSVESVDVNRINKYRDPSEGFNREEYTVSIRGVRGAGGRWSLSRSLSVKTKWLPLQRWSSWR